MGRYILNRLFLLMVMNGAIVIGAKAQSKNDCHVKIVMDSIPLLNEGNVARMDVPTPENANGKTYKLSKYAINGVKQKATNEKIVKQLGFGKAYTFSATADALQGIGQRVCSVSGYRLRTLTLVMDQTMEDAVMLTFDFEKGK